MADLSPTYRKMYWKAVVNHELPGLKRFQKHLQQEDDNYCQVEKEKAAAALRENEQIFETKMEPLRRKIEEKKRVLEETQFLDRWTGSPVAFCFTMKK